MQARIVKHSSIVNAMRKADELWGKVEARKSSDGKFYTVTGSKGARYTVELEGARPECYCPGGQNHGVCYHAMYVCYLEGLVPAPGAQPAARAS